MDDSIQLLRQMMDGSALRNHALAANVANVNTPDYRRHDVSFRNELKTAIQSGKPAAVSRWRPSVRTERTSRPVRLETEFAALSDNQLLYMTSTEALSRKYATIRRAIHGR